METAIFDELFLGVEDFGQELDVIELSGDVTTVATGEWVTTREHLTIGNKSVQFNVRYKFRDPILSSGILRKTITPNAPEGRIDFNATIVTNMDLQLQVGDEWMDIAEFAVRGIRGSSPGAAQLSEVDILQILAQYHWIPTARYPMYLQHLGAGVEAFAEFAEHFKSLGANDNTEDVKKRARGQKSTVQTSIRHQQGVPVATMELSKADRSRSANNSGFIGFLDARYGTLQQVLVAHKTRLAANKVLKDPAASEQDKQAAAKLETDIRNLFASQTAARAFRNWGGTTVNVDALDPNIKSYYAQQVPCGRLSVVDAAGNEHQYSVWTTANRDAQPALGTQAAEMLAEVDASTF